jgi:hypothetical protein
VAAELVIEMNHGQHNAEFMAKVKQQTQQGNRIRSTGNSHTDAVSGSDQMILPDVLQNTPRQFRHASWYIGAGSD